MKLTKKELKLLGTMIEESIMNESKYYNENLHIYKESENYKIKSKLYVDVKSEEYGHKVEINEESIFGLLDIS